MPEHQVVSNPEATDPSPWVVRWSHLATIKATVLDVACGYGRHARYFASLGHGVTAVDRDPNAIASLRATGGIEAVQFDLEQSVWPFSGRTFDVIVTVHYLHRPLLPLLLASLTPEGVLIYETFMQGNEAYGRPTNPNFLLAPGELLDWARPRLNIVAFEQGRADIGRPALLQRLCAVGRAYREPKLLQ